MRVHDNLTGATLESAEPTVTANWLNTPERFTPIDDAKPAAAPPPKKVKPKHDVPNQSTDHA